MIVLDATTDNLQVVLNADITTNQLQCVSSWRDITTTGYTPGRTVINTNSTTDVNLVASPGASTQRVIDTVSIYNKDTVNAQVIIKFDANGTEYEMVKASLGPKERLEYSEKKGRRVFTDVGSIKTVITDTSSNNSSSMSCVVLRQDVLNNNTTADTIIPISGLDFTIEQNKLYYVRCVVNFTSAATSTGCRLFIENPFAAYSVIGNTHVHLSHYPITTTTTTIATGTAAFGMTGLPATCAATGGNIAVYEGYISARHKRTVQMFMSSEITNSLVTIKAGSLVFYQEVV